MYFYLLLSYFFVTFPELIRVNLGYHSKIDKMFYNNILKLLPFSTLKYLCSLNINKFRGYEQIDVKKTLIEFMQFRRFAIPINLIMNNNITLKRNFPQHLLIEFKNMYKDKNSFPSCPICKDDTNFENLVITCCGHKFCNQCFEQIDKCSLCRENIK